jgi:hypothetical protein
VSHSRDHIIITTIGPVFSDAEVRECLTSQQCAQVDAILQKEEFTRKDKRKILRALEDALMDDGDD